MRDLIQLLNEASQPVNTTAAADKLRAVAAKFAGHPFGIHWTREMVSALAQRLRKERASYDAEASLHEVPSEPYDMAWTVSEFAEKLYQRASWGMFGKSIRDIDRAIGEYQHRKAEAMADKAGHESPYHFVESSDWLSAMDAQKDLARTLDQMKFDVPSIEKAASELDRFYDRWMALLAGGQDEEITLDDDVAKGIGELIPLMLTVLKVLGAKAD